MKRKFEIGLALGITLLMGGCVAFRSRNRERIALTVPGWRVNSSEAAAACSLSA